MDMNKLLPRIGAAIVAIMALSTFFIGCFFMPMTGALAGMTDGETGGGGVTAPVIRCVSYLPIGILAFLHFGKRCRVRENRMREPDDIE